MESLLFKTKAVVQCGGMMDGAGLILQEMDVVGGDVIRGSNVLRNQAT